MESGILKQLRKVYHNLHQFEPFSHNRRICPHSADHVSEDKQQVHTALRIYIVHPLFLSHFM